MPRLLVGNVHFTCRLDYIWMFQSQLPYFAQRELFLCLKPTVAGPKKTKGLHEDSSGGRSIYISFFTCVARTRTRERSKPSSNFSAHVLFQRSWWQDWIQAQRREKTAGIVISWRHDKYSACARELWWRSSKTTTCRLCGSNGVDWKTSRGYAWATTGYTLSQPEPV